MAKKRIHQRKKKRNRKKKVSTTDVPLCAIGAVLHEKDFFAPIHQTVDIGQKTIEYRPTDKLVFATLGIIAGAETVSEINTVLRPHRPLLSAFGYDKCADQSVGHCQCCCQCRTTRVCDGSNLAKAQPNRIDRARRKHQSGDND